MPSIEQSSRDREAENVEAVTQAREEFEAAFRRSRRGKLWRHWEGMTLTVFKRKGDGYFGWSISDSEGPRFSPGGFEHEEGGSSALASELSVGE